MKRARCGVRTAVSVVVASLLCSVAEARQYMRGGAAEVMAGGVRRLAEPFLSITPAAQFNMSRTPGLLSLSPDRKVSGFIIMCRFRWRVAGLCC